MNPATGRLISIGMVLIILASVVAMTALAITDHETPVALASLPAGAFGFLSALWIRSPAETPA